MPQPKNDISEMTKWVLLAILIGIGFLWTVVFMHAAYAHEHQHGESTEQARVIEFYRTWLRPKGSFSITHRQGSCCYANGDYQDCFPVKAVRRDERGTFWIMPDTEGAATFAQANYGGHWYSLSTGVEEDKQPDPRESPDGRSHVCIAGNNVICYVAGWGN